MKRNCQRTMPVDRNAPCGNCSCSNRRWPTGARREGKGVAELGKRPRPRHRPCRGRRRPEGELQALRRFLRSHPRLPQGPPAATEPGPHRHPPFQEKADMADTSSIKLEGRIFIDFNIAAQTGLHIGGSDTGIEIGGVDKTVIRDPLTNRPLYSRLLPARQDAQPAGEIPRTAPESAHRPGHDPLLPKGSARRIPGVRRLPDLRPARRDRIRRPHPGSSCAMCL